MSNFAKTIYFTLSNNNYEEVICNFDYGAVRDCIQ